MAETRRRVPPAAPEQAEPQEPPFYEATAPIPAPGMAPGAFPVAAYQPGDKVAPADVEANGWGGLVKVPEQFADVLAPPPKAPPQVPGDDSAGEPGTKEE